AGARRAGDELAQRVSLRGRSAPCAGHLAGSVRGTRPLERRRARSGGAPRTRHHRGRRAGRSARVRLGRRPVHARGAARAVRQSGRVGRRPSRQGAAHRQRAAGHRCRRAQRMIADEARAIPSVPAATDLSLRDTPGRTLLGTITAAHFSHHVTNSLLNPLLPLIRDAFAMSYAESGFAVSAFSIASGLANAPWGILADRVGSRTVIVGGLLLMGAVSVALTTAGSYWQLLFFLLLMGVVSGSYHGPAAALIARTFGARLRGTAMGIHITGGHLSFFAAPAVAGILATATGSWRTPYLWFAIAPIAFGGLLWLV